MGHSLPAALSALEASEWDLSRAIASLPPPPQQQGGGGGGTSAADRAAIAAAQAEFGDAEESVRAPIPMKRQRLCDSGPAGRGGKKSDYAARDMFGQPFSDFSRESDLKRRRRAGGGASSSASAASAPEVRDLSTIFAPPHEILFIGSFQQLLDEARSQKKWVLVNIQVASSFASHCLNRDMWKDDAVKALVRRSFMLWQQDAGSVGGKAYSQFYHPTEFPHIAVLCPRTRSQMLTLPTDAQTPALLVSKLGSFVEVNGDDIQPSASAASSASGSSAAARKKGGKSDDELRMEAAIRDSLAEMEDDGGEEHESEEAPGSGDEWSDDSDGKSPTGIDDVASPAGGSASNETAGASAAAAAGTTAATGTAAVASAPAVVDEVAAGDCVGEGGEPTRVKIRASKLPGGGASVRLVRELSDATKVAHLYGIVRREIAGGASFDLTTSFPAASLRESRLKTLAEAGLRDAAVVVRWT